MSLLPDGFLSTSGNQIVDSSGTPVKITAVNWYGFETDNFTAEGLDVRSYESMMNQMVSLGFNAIRLPFSLQLFDPGSTPTNIDYTLNPDLQGLTGPQIMDKIIDYAGQIGLKVILDDHSSAAGGGPNPNGLWYDSGYTEAQWISTWQSLATQYAGNSTVIGVDLSNEPHATATWGDGNAATDWQAAATRGGDAVQAVNPNLLILVEGVQNYDGVSGWGGGNLMGVADHPVMLTDADKLVYSPHDYPSSVYPQSWFSASDYPDNLTAVWDQQWGYIYQSDTAPILVGEYGSELQTTSDQQWISQLVPYMNTVVGGADDQGISWAYWDWNPTSSDTGGILEDDWTTVDPVKLAAISPGFSQATPNFAYTDPEAGDSGTEAGAADAGTASGLQQQYSWSAGDGAAIRANLSNSLLRGGPGDDALQVTSGSNMLDGGIGSNFLVGGTGADGGDDSFFMDARSGVTWNTIVNFHQGDQATLVGFTDGVSTMNLTASDGAPGYQGVTIHSELAGAGTGVTASLTFAGLNGATAAGHFEFSTGTASGNLPYLMITYQ